MRFSLLAWLLVQGALLAAAGSHHVRHAAHAAWPAMPIVLRQSHFGLMWIVGIAAGVAALGIAALEQRRARLPLAAAMIVMAFAHAGATHAADAGDFSTAELVHTVHLLATAGWAGVVIGAALPLRTALAVSAAGLAREHAAPLARGHVELRDRDRHGLRECISRARRLARAAHDQSLG
ncbi:MAG: hypothetical protein WDN30_03970 [Pararobbsia sp.]